jgi:hypothetical protein
LRILKSDVFGGIYGGIRQTKQWIPSKGGKAHAKADSAVDRHSSKSAKPKEKDFKLLVGYGLYLLVTPTNGKLWRFDYRYADKRKTMAFGVYPAITLADARQRRDDAKKLLANGVDPGEVKKGQTAATVAETEIRECAVKGCPLHSCRMGRRPKAEACEDHPRPRSGNVSEGNGHKECMLDSEVRLHSRWRDPFLGCDDNPVIWNVWDGIDPKYLERQSNVCHKTAEMIVMTRGMMQHFFR